MVTGRGRFVSQLAGRRASWFFWIFAASPDAVQGIDLVGIVVSQDAAARLEEGVM